MTDVGNKPRMLMLGVLLVGLAACAGTTPEAPHDFRALQKVKVEAARQRLRQAAESGDVVAQTELGADLWPEKAPEAVQWWEKAAAAGSCHAQGLLGYAYDNGEKGVPRNVEAAIRWYKSAAENGNTLSMMLLAQLLAETPFLGETPSKFRNVPDLPESYKWFEIITTLDDLGPTIGQRHKAVGDALSPAQRRSAKAKAEAWLVAHREILTASKCRHAGKTK